MFVIGISGLKGSGKSEVARILAENYGFQRAKFASGLKIMLFGFLAYRGLDDSTIDRMIEGDLKEVATPYLAGQTPRYAMQTLGTEWGRDCIGDSLWVEAAAQHIRNNYGPNDRVLLDDVRFDNEATAVRALGGIIWHVERPGIVQGAHASEHFSPAMSDCRVVNDGTLDELRCHVTRLAEAVI